ncbi:DUF1302 domain-containing protein [Roseateles cellulosilyticus]|uniref:DUF1302 domain-containing protein n=1 Tax=Pelomonas cellulosilytica TaxID=2906762 RepID=A0ABS8XXB0_9BURK|nr:DUF1302 family protein [Pelomonas sp. P8]MCE4556598.1 DUF1302 domain-containing protein [Pelomonas sp. P8]
MPISCPHRPTLLALAALLSTGARAVDLSPPESDWSVRFDNTVKTSAIYRLNSADPALVDSTRLLVPGVPASAFPQALNLNAGDDNFRNKGWVSKRVDLLSEFDAVYRKNLGLRVSAAAWYDASYHGTTAASDAGNGQMPPNAFPDRTRNVAGRKAEVLDAFVFGGFELDGGRKLTLRAGRHAVVYGESLFFGDNGIAQAQGPVDIFKLQSSPNAQFKEIVRPVPQVSAQLQLSPDLSVGGYYQLRWEANRMPPAGSFFSTSNTPWGSRLPEFVNGAVLLAAGEREPSNKGQYGLQVKVRLDETDLGFYFARYHDKGGQLYSQLNVTSADPGQYSWLFPAGIRTVGVSATRSFGDANFAVEASLRDGMPLTSSNMVYPNVAPEPRFAKGRTAHLNLSWLASLGPNFLARESSFVGELAWNRALSVDDPDHTLDGNRTRDATALQFVYSPSYRQVSSGLDLSVPVGLRYVLDGNSSVTGLGWGPRGTGQATLGIEGNYLGVWQFTATYAHHIGRAEPFVDYSPLRTGGTPTYTRGNVLADRDNLAFSLRRTF